MVYANNISSLILVQYTLIKEQKKRSKVLNDHFSLFIATGASYICRIVYFITERKLFDQHRDRKSNSSRFRSRFSAYKSQSSSIEFWFTNAYNECGQRCILWSSATIQCLNKSNCV